MKPCKECPFKKDSLPGWLGPYTAPVHFVHDAFTEEGMTCHMTVESDALKVCAGSLHCANKSAKLYVGELLVAQEAIASDTEAADECMRSDEFIEYHWQPWMSDHKGED